MVNRKNTFYAVAYGRGDPIVSSWYVEYLFSLLHASSTAPY